MKEELTLQNPWWENKSSILTDDKVIIATSVKPPITYRFIKENAILLGPRQVGKTTYLKLFVKRLIEKGVPERNIIYFSCEPLSTKNDLISLFREISDLSVEEGKKYIFLDEVTSVEDWEKAVKYFLEQKIIPEFQLLCTGSNALLLKKGSERFPGRDISIRLFLPLTFAEYVNNVTEIKFSPVAGFNLQKIYQHCKRMYPRLAKINRAFGAYLKTGGLPKPIYEYKEKKQISSGTYELYVNWILGSLARLNKRESIFRSLVKGIVSSYTSQVSLNALAKDFQIPTHTTVETYLELLNQLLLTNLLYHVDPKTKTPQFRKNKKIYFQDPFFYSVFKGFTYGKYQDYSQADEEKVIEGLVCQELASTFRTGPGISGGLWYFAGKKETDFVLRNDDSLVGIEVKWKSSAESKDFNNRFVFRERLLLSKTTLSYDDSVYIIPLSLFLLCLGSSSDIYDFLPAKR